MTTITITFKEQPSGLMALMVNKAKSADATPGEIRCVIDFEQRVRDLAMEVTNSADHPATMVEGKKEHLRDMLKAAGLDQPLPPEQP